MKKFLMFAAMAALCLSFSGCTFFETDTEALMRPPVFTKEQEKLNAALTEVIGESYVLKYPKTGDINSAFVFKDLDSDGTEEAMAFYSISDESTRINVLKKEGENWVSVYEAAGFYGEIERVEFAKMDEKGDAIVISWEQEAGIYRYGSEKLETLYKADCEGTDIADINGDGYDDIIVLSGNPVGRTNVNIAYSDGTELHITETISINAGYENIYSGYAGKLSEEKLVEIIRENFDLRPAGIIKMLDLRRPIYKQTAAYGHFGRNDLDLPWEKLDKVDDLKKYL